jgi:hypothetical protein
MISGFPPFTPLLSAPSLLHSCSRLPCFPRSIILGGGGDEIQSTLTSPKPFKLNSVQNIPSRGTGIITRNLSKNHLFPEQQTERQHLHKKVWRNGGLLDLALRQGIQQVSHKGHCMRR